MSIQNNIHGTGIVIDGCGVLIRGRSGAGKSLLALDLLEAVSLHGKSAFLVADDQLFIGRIKNELEMCAPPSTAGKIELRGRGIVSRAYVKTSPVHLVVDLVDQLERLVQGRHFVADIQGVTLARCPVPERGKADPVHQRLLVLEAIAQLDVAAIDAD